MSKSLSVLYFSGYGHTAKQAEAVAKGAKDAGASVNLIAISKEGDITEADWATLDASSAIIFGAPTYMGGPAWQFKKFVDASSKAWFTQKWKDKIAAGFTNSASLNGDKFSTISSLITLAMQHGMIWIGTGLLPANKKDSKRNDVNFLGGFSGALAQSPSDSTPEEGPLPGDLETASLLGKRVAEYIAK